MDGISTLFLGCSSGSCVKGGCTVFSCVELAGGFVTTEVDTDRELTIGWDRVCSAFDSVLVWQFIQTGLFLLNKYNKKQ